MKNYRLIIYFIGIGFLLWIACTSIAYRFINPGKTETEAFLHIPKSMMLDLWETSPTMEQSVQPDSGK